MPPAAPRRSVPGPYQRASSRDDLSNTADGLRACSRALGRFGLGRQAVVVHLRPETGRFARQRQFLQRTAGIAQALDEQADGARVEMARLGIFDQLIDRAS